MNILIVQPEGNINYNAGLQGIAEILAEAGHAVTYLGRKRPGIRQGLKQVAFDIRFEDAVKRGVGFRFNNPKLFRGFDLILAVDRGVIEGAEMAERFGARLGLISYEIFFPDETPVEHKRPEVAACRDLAFAIAPDELRASKLHEANGIPLQRIRHVPVAGRGYLGPISKPDTLNRMFRLPPGQRTVLYLGSLASWAGSQYLLQSTHAWPDQWTLVLHERYGLDTNTRTMIEDLGQPERIRISGEPFDSPADMCDFVASADLGFAAYTPTFKNEWVGHNIEHIGLSSGKIATYLQHGVPTATHDLGQISRLIEDYKAGMVFSLDQPFQPAGRENFDPSGCRRLFEEVLDLDRYRDIILEAVQL